MVTCVSGCSDVIDVSILDHHSVESSEVSGRTREYQYAVYICVAPYKAGKSVKGTCFSTFGQLFHQPSN